MNKKYYAGMDLLEEIKKRNIKEDTKVFNINADTTFIYKNGNLYNCYDNELIGSLLEIVDCDFMVLEDNTEEIEEIKGWGLATDYKDFETINHTLDRFGNKINELVKAINSIRKEKK